MVDVKTMLVVAVAVVAVGAVDAVDAADAVGVDVAVVGADGRGL